MKSRILASLVMLLSLFFFGLDYGSVNAAPPTPDNPAGNVLGIVPSKLHEASHGAKAGSNLVYHNGPVMHVNKVYAIYWVPQGYSVSSGYRTIIDGFFNNVATDSGKQSNVYYSDTQYYDNTSGNILYSSQFGGSVVDTSPLPANGCRDSYTSVCVSDTQIQAEIQKMISNNNWTANSTTMFFMFTAKGIGSCAGSSCAYSYYCAYHSWIGSGSNAILYANMPYADTVPAACDAGEHPNGDDADATLNVTSHEHNEAITDPQGNAWYDRQGAENGDKCAWNFGASLGSVSGNSYNQVIGNGKYYLQQEWSNKTSKCVLTGQ